MVQNQIFDFGLSPVCFMVYCYLCKCRNKKNGCYPSKRTVANACGVAVSSVSKAIKQLADVDLILITANYSGGRQINNAYQIADLSVCQTDAPMCHIDICLRRLLGRGQGALHRSRPAVAKARAEAMRRNIEDAGAATVWQGKIESKTTVCTVCGKPAGTGKFRNNCGSSMAAVPPLSTAQQTAPAYTPPMVSGAPEAADPKTAQDNKAMAVPAYIIFLIPLRAAKELIAQYHINQALVLCLSAFALSIVYSILTSILTAIFCRLGLAVIDIINAVNGKTKPLLVIGGIKILK